MRLSDLEGKVVRRQNGDRLGRVYEVRIRDSQLVALICGARGFWQRLTASRQGHRIAWSKVQRITARTIWIE
jgi:sporulation protein YlmC with PRC-barrel domain